MEYTEALTWLHSLGRTTDSPGPQRMKALMEELGNPHQQLQFVHIAGTNGKGSATVMLASVLREAGYTVGASISPYVQDFRERIQINGEYADADTIAKALSKVRKAVESIQTQVIEFMAVTAAAMLIFAERGCDVVCLEAGIGGGNDDTNVIENTLVACMMKVGLDHTELLGGSVDRIAQEKCGIFKNGCDVICYPDQPKAVMEVIRHQAHNKHCPLTVPGLQDFYFYTSPPFVNRCNYGGYDLRVPFPGVHQCLNASVVVEAALALWRKGFHIEDEHIVEGIKQAVLPGRIEVLQTVPLLILDGAHNEDSTEALARTLKMERVRGLSLVLGVLQDKNAKTMLRLLSPYINEVHTVTPDSPRAMSASELATVAGEYADRVQVCTSVKQALEAAQKNRQGTLVCGSLYLVSEARGVLCK